MAEKNFRPQHLILFSTLLNQNFVHSFNHLFSLIKLLAQFLYFERRTLPLDTLNKLCKVYEVLAPIHADAGPAIPWFNQPGKGTLFELSKSISQLHAEGKIREI
ncbi:TNT domain-containing protein [Citrobacter sp. BDA59-3]|uniref:TNT domain-containing protein n=1 Tax=Citrobacter sp. BDA59-3 TaxID=2781952 RepID=UPI00187FD77A|nr:TNT domain-containing protein [Citrobacter sp. BDA59-3]